MAILLFSLRGVPEDEAYEVRQLLTENDILFYETSAGNWGISMPALWLPNETHLEKARRVLNHYQQQRHLTQRQLYLVHKQAGHHKTICDSFKEKPLLFTLYCLCMGLTIYISIRILMELGLSCELFLSIFHDK
jgi:Family of unknown function (DUF6164)